MRTECQPVQETVNVTVYRTVPRTETVNVTVYKTVPRTETVNVTVYRTVPRTETVNVTVCRTVPRTETVNVTVYRTVTETRNEQYTVYTPRQVPHQGTRQVARCMPVQEKITLTRMVPVTVEREVTVCAAGYGGCDVGGGHRLFRHRGCRP